MVVFAALFALAAGFLLGPPTSGPTLAIERATVLTLESPEQVLARYTVLVEDGRISAVAPTAVMVVPAGATRIDAKGCFLIPGLADMHCHFLADDRIAEEYIDEELAVVVANGVTTVRDPIGKPERLVTRERIRNGELLGPTLFVGSQLAGRSWGAAFNGFEVKDPEAARAAVRRSKAEGYDFIKLTIAISRPVFDAAIEEARSLKIPVFGHVGPEVGLARALEAGIQIEHLDEYIEQLLPEDAPKRQSLSDIGI